jgi:hypothetical protein
MLNAELIRLGLARPRPDGRNLRYVDLFQELAEPDRAAPNPPHRQHEGAPGRGERAGWHCRGTRQRTPEWMEDAIQRPVTPSL